METLGFLTLCLPISHPTLKWRGLANILSSVFTVVSPSVEWRSAPLKEQVESYQSSVLCEGRCEDGGHSTQDFREVIRTSLGDLTYNSVSFLQTFLFREGVCMCG